MRTQITDYWLKWHILTEGRCGLCWNSGVVSLCDGSKAPCLRPNCQTLAKKAPERFRAPTNAEKKEIRQRVRMAYIAARKMTGQKRL